jgi:GntR family transcriptional regulator
MMRSARSRGQTLTEAAQKELREAIASGTFRPGTQLPTEAELVGILGVSRTVVREALRALEEDGLIARRHGVGTFVRESSILKNLNFNFGITEMIRSAGFVPGTSSLEVRREAAEGEIAAELGLAPGTPLITIARVRTADGKPVVYSLDTFAESLVRGGEFDPNRLLNESLYQTLQVEFGLVIEYGVTKILPAQAAPPIAEKLGLAEGSLLLYVVQTDYSSADEPVLYSREYHLPDAFDFVIWRKGPTKLRSAPPSQEPTR